MVVVTFERARASERERERERERCQWSGLKRYGEKNRGRRCHAGRLHRLHDPLLWMYLNSASDRPPCHIGLGVAVHAVTCVSKEM